MTRFDAPALLATVDAGQPPSDARVFHARRTYFYAQGCVSFFVAAICGIVVGLLGFVLATGALLTTPSTSASRNLSEPGDWQLVAFAVLFLLGFIGFAVVSIGRGIGAVRGLRTRHTHVLVLTPDGFVARTGTSLHALFSVSYTDLAAISLSIQHARYGAITDLVLTYRRPIPHTAGATRLEQVVWRVDERFGSPDAIAQAVLEDHTRAVARAAPHLSDGSAKGK